MAQPVQELRQPLAVGECHFVLAGQFLPESLCHGDSAGEALQLLEQFLQTLVVHFDPFALDQGQSFGTGQQFCNVFRGQGYPVHGEGRLEGQQGIRSQQRFFLVSDLYGKGDLPLSLAPPVGNPAPDAQVFNLGNGLQEFIGFLGCQSEGMEYFAGSDEPAV